MAKEYIIFLNSLSNIIDKYILTNINSYEHKAKERYIPRNIRNYAPLKTLRVPKNIRHYIPA
jgi:hypothetical protein